MVKPTKLVLLTTILIRHASGFTTQIPSQDRSRTFRQSSFIGVVHNVLDESKSEETFEERRGSAKQTIQKNDLRFSQQQEGQKRDRRQTGLCNSDKDDDSNERSDRNKIRFFANLPVEADQKVTIDQEIIASILKEPMVEVVDILLVLLSSSLVALSTLNTIDLKTLANLIRMENAIAFVFATEFFLRWYSQFRWKGILQYMTQPLVVVDLFVVILPLIPLIIPNNAAIYSIFPSWLFSASGIINLRLLRILRLQRVLTDIDTFTDFQTALGIPRSEVKPYKLQLARVILSIFTLFSVSSGLIYSTEHAYNPNIPDYFTAMYFGLTTITTVGFGDITPVTPEGKLVVSGTILAGVAVVPTQTAALVEALLQRDETRQQKNNQSKQLASSAFLIPSEENTVKLVEAKCSNCGAKFHWGEANYCYSCGTQFKKPIE